MAEWTVDGVHLYYEERGQGLPLVLVHGFPLDHSIWEPVAAELKAECRLILPDLRGHGRSQSTPGAVEMSRLADDLRGLLDHLGLERAVLVGHSMGGYACLNFAERYPERLAGLGLVATTSAADTPERAKDRYAQARQVATEGVKVVAESMPARLSADPVIREQLRHLIEQTSVEGVQGALLGMAQREDTTPHLGEIQAPVVVVAGVQDQIVPVAVMREMATHFPQQRFSPVAGGGHVPMLEAPQAVVSALRDLLHVVERTRPEDA